MLPKLLLYGIPFCSQLLHCIVIHPSQRVISRLITEIEESILYLIQYALDGLRKAFHCHVPTVVQQANRFCWAQSADRVLVVIHTDDILLRSSCHGQLSIEKTELSEAKYRKMLNNS